MDFAYLLFSAMFLSLVLYQLNQRVASPVLAIFNRWLRWIIFALGGARIAHDLVGSIGHFGRCRWLFS